MRREGTIWGTFWRNSNTTSVMPLLLPVWVFKLNHNLVMFLLFFKFFEKKNFKKDISIFVKVPSEVPPKKMVPTKNCRVRSKNFFCEKYQFSPKIKVFSGHINQNLGLKKKYRFMYQTLKHTVTVWGTFTCISYLSTNVEFYQ